MVPEINVAELHEVDSHSPASQDAISGKLENGEEVHGVRWLDTHSGKWEHKFAYKGKHYMGEKIGAENEFLFKLI